MPFCVHCGVETLESAKFCVGCGVKVAPEEEVSQEIPEITEDTISDEGRVSFDLNPYSNKNFALVVIAIIISISQSISHLTILERVERLDEFTASYLIYIIISSLILAYLYILIAIKLRALLERIFQGFQIQIIKYGLLLTIFWFLSFGLLFLNKFVGAILIFGYVGAPYDMISLLTPILISGMLLFASGE